MTEKNKVGRPPHEPTPETRNLVKTLAGFGIPQKDIGTKLGIHDETLRFHYREELDTGAIEANSRVAQNLFKKATGDNNNSVTAAIFWLKTRAQWREKQEIELSGAVDHKHKLDLSKLTDEELAILHKAMDE